MVTFCCGGVKVVSLSLWFTFFFTQSVKNEVTIVSHWVAAACCGRETIVEWLERFHTCEDSLIFLLEEYRFQSIAAHIDWAVKQQAGRLYTNWGVKSFTFMNELSFRSHFSSALLDSLDFDWLPMHFNGKWFFSDENNIGFTPSPCVAVNDCWDYWVMSWGETWLNPECYDKGFNLFFVRKPVKREKNICKKWVN